MVKKNKKILIGSIISVIVLITIGSAFVLTRKNDAPSPNVATSTNDPVPTYTPPTAEDAERVESNKQKILDREESLRAAANQPDGKKLVKPVLTFAGQYGQDVETGAYVDIFEEGGTCTATFTQGSEIVEKSAPAIRGARSVDCSGLSIDASQFKIKGTYIVVVSYDSATSNGKSDSRNIEVK